jgi:catechol 2,3-dioxygenase-like lactoylglutathione lyase family enzyme
MMENLVEMAFFTDDAQGMINFYEAFLGQAPVAQSDGMAIFMVGNTKLFIHKNYVPGEGELPPENHIAFAVENVDEACQRLKQQGLKVEVDPDDYYWGRSAYLRDPDGHLIELTQGN